MTIVVAPHHNTEPLLNSQPHLSGMTITWETRQEFTELFRCFQHGFNSTDPRPKEMSTFADFLYKEFDADFVDRDNSPRAQMVRERRQLLDGLAAASRMREITAEELMAVASEPAPPPDALKITTEQEEKPTFKSKIPDGIVVRLQAIASMAEVDMATTCNVLLARVLFDAKGE